MVDIDHWDYDFSNCGSLSLLSWLTPYCTVEYTANVNRQTTDKLLFSYAIITGENV